MSYDAFAMTEHIETLINNGNIQEAIETLDAAIDNSPAKNDRLFYLRGNAYRKSGDWKKALDNYLEAIDINPDSPAKEAYRMAMDIMEFYNKDMFNQ